MRVYFVFAIALAVVATVLLSCESDRSQEPRLSATIRVPHDYPTIQSAIDAAADGATILVAPGTYAGAGNRNIDFSGKAITLVSEAGPDEATIDCEGVPRGLYRGFYFGSHERSSSRLEGFTIRNGSVEGDRQTGLGGGILCTNHSSPIIANCKIVGNIAGSNGGGIYCDEGAMPIIADCEIEDNWAGKEGGGIYCNDCKPTIINCRISENHAELHGGGIFCTKTSLRIRSCIIEGNSIGIGDGGGLCLWGYSYATITNCLISGNSSQALGGGLFFAESPAFVTNCTIVRNEAEIVGGGIYCRKGSSPVVTNCILWGDAPQEIHVHVDDITVTYSDIEGGWHGQGNINQDPLFVENGSYDLSSDSPCIDAGRQVSIHDDLDGDIRPWDHPEHANIHSAFDMGSDEFVD
jgi:predicted outer membrane repeat protein